MRNSELWACLAIFVTLGVFLLGGEMVDLFPPLLSKVLAAICFLFALGIAFWLLIKNIYKGIKDKRGHIGVAETQKNKQISINIGINSSDFADDKMSTKRMNDFHKLVESISKESSNQEKKKKR